VQLDKLFYKVVFNGCLFIPHSIVQHNGIHNFKIRFSRSYTHVRTAVTATPSVNV
jgi:hypothetical protein